MFHLKTHINRANKWIHYLCLQSNKDIQTQPINAFYENSTVCMSPQICLDSLGVTLIQGRDSHTDRNDQGRDFLVSCARPMVISPRARLISSIVCMYSRGDLNGLLIRILQHTLAPFYKPKRNETAVEATRRCSYQPCRTIKHQQQQNSNWTGNRWPLSPSSNTCIII